MYLHGLYVPDRFNGIGLHDSPGTHAGTMDVNTARGHAHELQEHGVTAYKLLVDNTKHTRAQEYVREGLFVMARHYTPRPWGRPPSTWLPSADVVRSYRDRGVALQEFGNEFNIAEEWDGSIPGASTIARTVVDAWVQILDLASRVPGVFPLFPSNTPGGHVDHRLCYGEICDELVRRGLQDTVKHVAVHPRPFNNPPTTPWTATNTVTFNEWDWIRKTFADHGMRPYFWATEHGYFINCQANTNYPRIDLGRWTDYNWQLFMMLNHGHQHAVAGELAGVFHWFERGWGHWGAWAADAIVDSPAPEMPAPSPLWVKMRNENQYMQFQRRPTIRTAPPPPPPPPPPPSAFYIRDVVDEMPTARPFPSRNALDITASIVHHAGSGERVQPYPARYAKAIARWHIRWGWAGIAYHFVVVAKPDGSAVILQVGELGTIRPHSGNASINAHSCGIMLSGNNVGTDVPTDDQVEALWWLLERLGKRVRPHKHIVTTYCPGDLRRKWWQTIKGRAVAAGLWG